MVLTTTLVNGLAYLSVMALIVSLDHLCECVEKLYLEHYTLHHAYLLLPIS